MRKYIYILASLLAVFTFFSCNQKSKKLLLGGSGWNKIAIIDKESKEIEWEYPLADGWECNSVAATIDGNILFAYSKGAKLITKTQKEIWDIAAPEGCEMQSAKILPNGNCLLAWCGHPATILEVNPKGTILKQTTFDTGIENPHSQFRQVSKNKNGNYILPLLGRREVVEITPEGEPVKSMKVPGGPFCAIELDNGNYLVACGDAHTYVEIDFNKDKIVRQVNAGDIDGLSLRFVAQLLPTAHNGLYLCNWQGHGSSADNNPQLVELDGSGRIVWSLNDNHTFGMISAVCPID